MDKSIGERREERFSFNPYGIKSDPERTFLDDFLITSEIMNGNLSMKDLRERWTNQKYLEIIDGSPTSPSSGALKWDSSIYLGDLGLGSVIQTDILQITGETIKGEALENSQSIAKLTIIFAVIEDVEQNHESDTRLICDLLSTERTYLVNLKENNKLDGHPKADLSDDERAVVDTLTSAWKQRQAKHACGEVNDVHASK